MAPPPVRVVNDTVICIVGSSHLKRPGHVSKISEIARWDLQQAIYPRDWTVDRIQGIISPFH
jgi:hypothetical protein